MNYLVTISEALGVSMFMLIIILVWSYIWKLLALWESARKGSVAWFIILAVVNTVGILEILYIFVFSKMKWPKKKQLATRKKKR